MTAEKPFGALPVKKFGIETVRPDAIYDVGCDIFSPNALGASINPETLPRIQAKVIAGGTDEIQRNIISERVLGLPAEQRMDKAPFSQLSKN